MKLKALFYSPLLVPSANTHPWQGIRMCYKRGVWRVTFKRGIACTLADS